jgi:hypothetical protein
VPYRSGGVVWLSPTRLSLALSGGNSSEAQKEVTDGFILVETNYKVASVSITLPNPINIATRLLKTTYDPETQYLHEGTLTADTPPPPPR